MTHLPIQTPPVQRTRTFRSASSTRAESLNPSISNDMGIPFDGASVDPSIILLPPVVFADDGGVDPSIILLPPVVFADDAE